MLPSNARRTGYVLKVYPRFSETFIVTEILAREAAGEDLLIFALRHSTDARFHPELARVQAPVTFVPKPAKLSEAWELVADATRTVPGFAERYAALLPELADCDPTEVHQGIALATSAASSGLTHLHAHFGSLAGRTAEIAAELAGITFSVTTHAKDLFHESVDPVRLGRTLRRASHTVTISRFNLDHLAGEYPDLAGRTHLLYNGLELDRFPFREPRVPGAPLRIAAVGRLVEKKGFALLLDAVSALEGLGIAADVRIAGDGELRGELEARIERLGLKGPRNTAVLLGPQTQAEVRALLDWADVFAAPCTVGADGNADGLPTVLLEAMAVGVPCVATAVTGIPEAIHNGGGTAGSATGVLVNPDDGEALVRALARTAEPSFPRHSIARAARALVERRFDSAAQARALARLEDAARASGEGTPWSAADETAVAASAANPALPTGVEDLAGLRVAYACVDPGIPFFGTKGASVHVQEIVRAFRARGAEVRLYCTRAGNRVPAELADLDVTELRIPAGTTAEREAAQLAASREMSARIAADGADLVYERYSLFSTVLATLAEADGIRGILEVNAPLIDEQRTHRELVLEDHAWRALSRQVGAAARTVCVSEPVAQWVRGHADASAARRVAVVANGVNTARIRPGGPAGGAGERGGPACGAAAGGNARVVFVGTLKPWHGVETLIDAVARSAGDWRLQIVGDGPLGEALRERAAAHGPATSARIEFAGAVEPERVGTHLRRADIAVAPYPAAAAQDAYFSPLKIYEYLAAGLPIVASRVGQVPGIVADGRTGVLVEPSDAGALAAALDALAADPARRAALGGNARAEAVTEHGWEQVLERMLVGLEVRPTARRVQAGALS